MFALGDEVLIKENNKIGEIVDISKDKTTYAVEYPDGNSWNISIFDEKQLEFLEKEFGITKSDIAGYSEEEWKEIRLKCFAIEGDFAMDMADSDSAYLPERGEIAASIADTKYSELVAQKLINKHCKE